MNNVWVQSANNYMLKETSTQKPMLPTGVYKFQTDPFDNPFLIRVQDKFHFPYKIYGVETEFIDRVVRSWEHTTGNFGIILNGLKGTGKTVTAELIANKLGLPVIIVSNHHPKLVSFLNEIQQDVIVFVDEYEKIYNGWENSLLTIMDGALKTQHRLFFLLTTNELKVDRNLLQRPSRIRYIKTFSDLTLPVIMEVVMDKLMHVQWYNATVKFISELPIITMDLVKSVIEEVNIHDENPIEFKEIFNIHCERRNLFNVYKLQDGSKEKVETYASVTPERFTEQSQGSSLDINHQYIGKITKVISDNEVLVQEWDDSTDSFAPNEVVYMFESAIKIHSAFSTSAFAF